MPCLPLQSPSSYSQYPQQTQRPQPSQRTFWRNPPARGRYSGPCGMPGEGARLAGGIPLPGPAAYLASLLIASEADVKTVQARTQLASATTALNTYSHLWPDKDESARAAVD